MSLVDALVEIRKQLQERRFANEQAISQGVVLRVLAELGWNQYDTETVCPEYPVGSGRVDFALCFSAKRPQVLVEVKRLGQADGADEQLFAYAFKHGGVPMVVLTDGNVWGFYLPGEAGSYDDRRIYKLDLLERSVEECAEKFFKYLAFQRVTSGVAIEEAKRDYQDQNRRTLAHGTIPQAWRDLIDGEDPELLDRLAREVETKCGVKPDPNDLSSFLRQMIAKLGSAAPARTAVASPVLVSSGHSTAQFTLRGKIFPCKDATEVMIGIFKNLALQDPGFPERFYRHEGNRGRIRTYVARSAEEMYPNSPNLPKAKFADPDWFIATNMSNPSKEKLIALASEVAGLRPNSDLIYSF